MFTIVVRRDQIKKAALERAAVQTKYSTKIEKAEILFILIL